MKFSDRLRELRTERGYTQEQLANLLHTSRSRIGMYEKGQREPDFEMQEAIADLFNVKLDYLMGREDRTPEYDPAMLVLLELYSNMEQTQKNQLTDYAVYLNSICEKHRREGNTQT